MKLSLIRTTSVLVLVTSFTASFASAASNSPLDPFYCVKDAADTVSLAPEARYVDKNPLHPGYSRLTGSSWVATKAVASTVLYGDTANPLHPQFKRW
jgi:hypothetical protein